MITLPQDQNAATPLSPTPPPKMPPPNLTDQAELAVAQSQIGGDAERDFRSILKALTETNTEKTPATPPEEASPTVPIPAEQVSVQSSTRPHVSQDDGKEFTPTINTKVQFQHVDSARSSPVAPQLTMAKAAVPATESPAPQKIDPSAAKPVAKVAEIGDQTQQTRLFPSAAPHQKSQVPTASSFPMNDPAAPNAPQSGPPIARTRNAEKPGANQSDAAKELTAPPDRPRQSARNVQTTQPSPAKAHIPPQAMSPSPLRDPQIQPVPPPQATVASDVTASPRQTTLPRSDTVIAPQPSPRLTTAVSNFLQVPNFPVQTAAPNALTTTSHKAQTTLATSRAPSLNTQQAADITGKFSFTTYPAPQSAHNSQPQQHTPQNKQSLPAHTAPQPILAGKAAVPDPLVSATAQSAIPKQPTQFLHSAVPSVTAPNPFHQNADALPEWSPHLPTPENSNLTDRLALSTTAKLPPPQIVTRQIAQHILQAPGFQSEIHLSPDELGRVRISINTADQGVSLHISADRIETLDLLRRNIGLLGQEFAALGYSNLNFSFSQQGQNSNQPETGAAQSDSPQKPEHPNSAPPLSHTVISTASDQGLDIRL
ncbi:MAG: flagellar hook-length control protein FliK [Cognatishimia sp.]